MMKTNQTSPLVRSSKLLSEPAGSPARAREVDSLLETYRDWWLSTTLGYANEGLAEYFDELELGFGLPVAFVERERAAVMMAEFVSVGRAHQLRNEGCSPAEIEAEVRLVLMALPSTPSTGPGEEDVGPNEEELANHVVEAVMRELLRRAGDLG